MANSSDSAVLIIGGGHNGLVCACYLARRGLRVAVFEAQSVVGGAAVTEEFHPGFRNSAASYTVSLLSPEVIRELGLAGLEEYREAKHIWHNTRPAPAGWFANAE